MSESARHTLALPAGFPMRVLAALLVLTVFLPSAASAFRMEMKLLFPSRVILDEVGSEVSGNFLSQVSVFSLVSPAQPGNLQSLILEDFFIPNTASIFGAFYSFDLEDPASAGSYGFQADLALIWNVATGEISSDPFRVQVTMHSLFVADRVSFFDLVLTTNGTAAISCGSGFEVNTHPAAPGLSLPPGGVSQNSRDPIIFAAAACAVDEPGVQNDLTSNILIVELNSQVPEPGTGLLVSGGLIILAARSRRRRLQIRALDPDRF